MTRQEEKLLIRIFAKRLEDLKADVVHMEKFVKDESSPKHKLVERAKEEIKQVKALERKLLNK